MFFVLVLDLGFPGDSDGKESACNTGDLGLISGSGRFPGKGNGYPFQYSCLENSMGQRSPVGYSPWCCRESDMTERLTLFSLLYLIYRPHGSLSGKGPACQCRRRRRLGFDPWVGKIPLEEETATHSSILAWRILWTEEPGGLQSMWSQRVGHDRARTHI